MFLSSCGASRVSIVIERLTKGLVLMCQTFFPLACYNKVINLIILHIMQYVFTCLLQNIMPNLFGLLCYLNLKCKVATYAAGQSFK